MERNDNSKAKKKKGTENIIRFVKVQFTETNRFHGYFVSSAKCETFGLQVNDKIYLVDGRYKCSSGKQLKIVEEYPPYPEWVTEELREKYDNATGKGTLFDWLNV